MIIILFLQNLDCKFFKEKTAWSKGKYKKYNYEQFDNI